MGEPFAEQPYAVAVQQGSHLQEEVSKVILELQKDRYFETLSSRYWNSTLRSLCPTLDDSEGRSISPPFVFLDGCTKYIILFDIWNQVHIRQTWT